MKKLLGIATLAALLMAPAFAVAEKTQISVSLQVDGMTCTGCVAAVKGALMKVDGVKTAQVSLERNEAVVEYDPAKTSPDALAKAVTKAGYKASVKGAGK